jgi:hypothetical protein
METEVLRCCEYASGMRGEATVRFTYRGVVFFNHAAVMFLKLLKKGKEGYFSVHICRDLKNKSDFGVFKDEEGWKLRRGSGGGAVFNCVGLARHVIDATWDVCRSHPVGAVKPTSYVFRIAREPWDDEKNKDVFALLRRKA